MKWTAEKRMRKEDGGFARDGARHVAKNLAKLAETSDSRLCNTNCIMLPCIQNTYACKYLCASFPSTSNR